MSDEESDKSVQGFLSYLGREVWNAADKYGDLAAGVGLISMGSQFAARAGMSREQCKLLIDKTFDFANMFTSKGGEG